MAKNIKINVKDVEITITIINEEDYILLTDMVKSKERIRLETCLLN